MFLNSDESNLRPSDSALRCPTTEPQRLYGEQGLLGISCGKRLAVQPGSAMSIESCL